jgi:hypothetical protein
MPAHHRFHPYEIQAIAFYFSLLPGIAAAALAFGTSRLEKARRARKPATLTRASLPILLERSA